MKKFITKPIYIVLVAMLCAWNLNAQEFYTIAVSSNLPQYGEVFGGGVYSSGEVITIEAEASYHFMFSAWLEDGVPVSFDAIYTFEVTEDRVLVARFDQIIQFIITVSSNPPEGGDPFWQSPGYYGLPMMIFTTARLGYEFVNWTEDGIEISTDESFILIVEQNHNLVANFVPTTAGADVTLSASPAEGGEVFGGGFYTYGSTVTITAVPNPNYQFVKWTSNGYVISTEADYSFLMSEPRNLVAHFVPLTCEITLSKNIEGGGEIFGAGIYPYGQTVIVYASQNFPQYQLYNWTEDGNVVTNMPTFTFPATQSRHLVANFGPALYDIPVYANPYGSGVVTGGGIYTYGSSVTISATANEGYHFLNWTKYMLGEVIEVITEPVHTYTIEGEGWGNAAFVAYFAEGAKIMVLTNIPGGEVLGSGVYQYGDEVTLEAIPNPDYVFVNWATEGRNILSTDNPYRFTVTEDMVITANFAEEGVLPIETIDGGAMMIYPNPTQSEMTVILNDATLNIVEMELYDIAGKKVYQQTVNQSTGTLKMNDLETGIYLLKVLLDNGETVIQKVVRQ